uniref:Gamma-glutamyltransferase 6 n=1 Tax=Chelonoidis abingdonii TaxID=106734 RepID=A0A8C0HBA9_CHEAB
MRSGAGGCGQGNGPMLPPAEGCGECRAGGSHKLCHARLAPQLQGRGVAQALPCQTGPTVPVPPVPDAQVCRCLAETCSRLGKDLLVDARIAAALCLRLVHPHAAGLGEYHWELHHGTECRPVPWFSRHYGLPVALPGLHLLHRHFGRLARPCLLKGPAALAQRGVRMDRELAAALQESVGAVKASGLCSFFCDGAGELKGQGALVTQPQLVALLRTVASGDKALPQALAPDLPPAERKPFPQAMGDLGLELQSPRPCSWATPVLQEVRAAEPRAVPEPCLRALTAPGERAAALSLSQQLRLRFLAPASGIVLSDLTAPAGLGLLSWACPMVLSLGEEGTVVGLGAPGGSAAPLAQAQDIINQGYLGGGWGPQAGPWVLHVASQSEHARAFAAPAMCCHHEGY